MEETPRISEHHIKSIIEVLLHLPPDAKNVAIAFDWDQSTILGDGDDESGLRENDTTFSTIQEILNRNGNFFILTSRYHGCSLEKIDKKYIPQIEGTTRVFSESRVANAMDRMSESMHSFYKLFPSHHQTFVFASTTGRCVELNDAKLARNTPCLFKNSVLITPNIVFAGSRNKDESNKGPAMGIILDLHKEALLESSGDSMFSSRNSIDHVIFVDNDPDHIASMKEAFQTRSERLTLLYYPI